MPLKQYSQKYVGNTLTNYCNKLYGQYNKPEITGVTNRISNIFNNTGISKRDLIYDPSNINVNYNIDDTYPQIIKDTSQLVREGLIKTFANSGCSANKIDKVIFSSGIPNSPHISLHAMSGLGFSKNIKHTPMVSLGCVGGAYCLSEAHDYLKANPNQTVLTLNVECASRYFMGPYQYKLNKLAENLKNKPELANSIKKELLHEVIVSSILGDGVGFTILTNKNTKTVKDPNANLQIIDTLTTIVDDSLHLTGQVLEQSGFRAIIHPELSETVVPNAVKTIHDILEKNSLKTSDIKYWFIHPGGQKVLNKIKQESNLTDNELKYSIKSLNEFGNMSSVSVINVLEQTTQNEILEKGSNCILLAMGPGITIQTILLKVH
jgi:alkylresorcinol/alkylpyrone synthase